ncbi:MAG: 1-acyl-sn-glycerol-3-phosphate acyltransferase [Bacteroidetes bacterium]|nr:1-acyl-sn-glycerol-3-phosphate acyltransferase [Bacteroidota bacterium]
MRQLFLNIIYKGFVPFVLKPLTGVKYKHSEVLTEAKQFIIIANHNSHIDTLALMSVMPGHKIKEIKPVAAGDYFGANKWTSLITKMFVNALLIPRCCSAKNKKNEPFRIMIKALKRGQSLIIYPEGSRGKANEMQEFKNGIGHILLKYPHIAYIPTYIENTGKVLPKDAFIPVPFNCRVVFGELHYCKGQNAKEVVTNMYNEVCELKAA